MMIEEKTVYETRGKTFPSREKAEQYRADLLGEFFDKMPPTLHPRERIELNAFVVANRAALRELLDY